MAKVFLDRKVSFFDRNLVGEMPIHWAARSGSIPCLKLLVDRGASVKALVGLFTPLFVLSLLTWILGWQQNDCLALGCQIR